jgi:hypothetical protein
MRACDLCKIFDSDEEAGDAASLQIQETFELADNLTQVRAADENIRKATDHLSGSFGGTQPLVVERRKVNG